MMARFQYLAEVIPAVHTANSLHYSRKADCTCSSYSRSFAAISCGVQARPSGTIMGHDHSIRDWERYFI